MSRPFTVRKVDFEKMATLLRTIQRNPGIGYEGLYGESTGIGFRSHSRLFHYLSTGRCLDLVIAFKGHYDVSKFGKAFAENIEGGISGVELARAISPGLEGCPPVQRLLGAFLPREPHVRLEDVIRSGDVLRAESQGRAKFHLTSLDGAPRLAASTVTEVNAVRWGTIPMLVDFGILKWLNVSGEIKSGGRFLFPIAPDRNPQAWRHLLLDELESTGAGKRWVPLSLVLQRMALRYRCEPERVKAVIVGLAKEDPTRTQLSEASRVLVQDDGFVIYRGTARSHIRLGGISNA